MRLARIRTRLPDVQPLQRLPAVLQGTRDPITTTRTWYGYGPHGRGYFYFDLHYDSYVFYPSTVVRYDNYGTYSGDYGYPTGELRLQVRPRDAQVFVDGAYAGTVDEFDGTFQSLRLESGDYQVELVLPGTSRSTSTFASRLVRRSRIGLISFRSSNPKLNFQLPTPNSQILFGSWELAVGS